MIKDMNNLPQKTAGIKILEEKTPFPSSSSKDFLSALPVSSGFSPDAKTGLNAPQPGIAIPNKEKYKKAMFSPQLSCNPIGSSDMPSNFINESNESLKPPVKEPAKDVVPEEEEKRSKAEQQKQEQINKYDENAKDSRKTYFLKTECKEISIKLEFLRTRLQELENKLSWEIEENIDNPNYDPSPLQMEIERKHLSIQKLIMEQEKLIREMESIENKPFDINSLRLEVIDYSINKTKSKINAFDENAYKISQSIEKNLAYEDSGFKSTRFADTSYDYTIEENEMPEAVKIFREYGNLVKKKTQNLEKS